MSMISWQPGVTLAEIEKAVILKAYGFYQKNKTHTAAALGISVKTLYSKLLEYGVINVEATDIPPDKGNGLESTHENSSQQSMPLQERQEVQVLPLANNASSDTRKTGKKLSHGNAKSG